MKKTATNVPDREVIREVHDLPSFPRDLHLLLGVSVLLEFVDVRYDVERQGVGEDLVLRHLPLPAQYRPSALHELVHAGLSGAGGSLVRLRPMHA